MTQVAISRSTRAKGPTAAQALTRIVAQVGKRKHATGQRNATVAGARGHPSGKEATSRLKFVANAVANDPDLAGRDLDALNLLASDDAGISELSGPAMVKLLKMQPASSSSEAKVSERAEAAARDVMRQALSTSKNSGIAAFDRAPARAQSNVWDEVLRQQGS